MKSRVLVVDDEESVVDLVQAKLASAGIMSDSACTAEDALAKMQAHLYLVVVADIHMPGMGGVQLVSALKEISPLVQVIMLTGDATLERVIECMDRGAADFFSKTEYLHPMVESVSAALGRGSRWANWLRSTRIGKPAIMAGAGNE